MVYLWGYDSFSRALCDFGMFVVDGVGGATI
jgi:hypothetical protein